MCEVQTHLHIKMVLNSTKSGSLLYNHRGAAFGSIKYLFLNML